MGPRLTFQHFPLSRVDREKERLFFYLNISREHLTQALLARGFFFLAASC